MTGTQKRSFEMVKRNPAFNLMASEFAKYAISAAIFLVSASGMIGLYWLKEPPKTKESPSYLPTVATTTIDRFSGTLTLQVSGLVVPYREIKIAAEVAGQIEKKTEACQAGKFVEKGTLLLQIEDTDYQLELKRLQAELAQSQTRHDELENEIAGLVRSVEFAEEEFELQQNEYNRRQQIGSALSTSELEAAKRGLNQAERSLTELKDSLNLRRTGLARLESGIELSQIQIEKAELNIRRTKIIAPFDGVVVEDRVEGGDYVQKGQVVASFEDTSKAEVTFSLRADQLDQLLRFGAPTNPQASMRDAYQLPLLDLTIRENRESSPWKWQGYLAGFDGAGLDELTKTIPCRALVDQPVSSLAIGSRALVRGMLVQVQLLLPIDTRVADAESLFLIPAIAIHPGGVVWQVKQGKLQRRLVEILDHVEILPSTNEETDPSAQNVVVKSLDGQLDKEQAVVTSPLAAPQQDAAVKIIEAREAGTSL